MSALRSKRSKESDKSILLALVKKRGVKFSTAILEHIEDVGMSKLMNETSTSERVSEETIMKILKGKRALPKKIKEVNDPELLKALTATKSAKRVGLEDVTKSLKGKGTPRKKAIKVNDPEMFEAMKDSKDPEIRRRGDAALIKMMDAIPNDSPTVSSEDVFRILRGKK